MKLPKKLYRVTGTLESSLTMPMFIFNMIVMVFGAVGLSEILDADETALDKLGGADVWWMAFSIYPLLLIINIFVWTINRTKGQDIEDGGLL